MKKEKQETIRQTTVYCAEHDSGSIWFDTEKELLEYYNQNQEELDYDYPQYLRYDYMGDYAGKTDVLMASYLSLDTKKISYNAVLFQTIEDDLEHFTCGEYINQFTNIKWYNFSGNNCDLREVYSVFRDRGISFTNDIYKQEAKELNIPIKQLVFKNRIK